MAHEKELESYCVEIPAKADYHRFLIGKKGANVQKVCVFSLLVIIGTNRRLA